MSSSTSIVLSHDLLLMSKSLGNAQQAGCHRIDGIPLFSL
jgi:hypothetical protein